MSLLLSIADWLAAVLLMFLAARLSFNAWPERHDRDAFMVGAGMALVLVLIALRLVFK